VVQVFEKRRFKAGDPAGMEFLFKKYLSF